MILRLVPPEPRLQPLSDLIPNPPIRQPLPLADLIEKLTGLPRQRHDEQPVRKIQHLPCEPRQGLGGNVSGERLQRLATAGFHPCDRERHGVVVESAHIEAATESCFAAEQVDEVVDESFGGVGDEGDGAGLAGFVAGEEEDVAVVQTAWVQLMSVRCGRLGLND